MPFSSKNTKRRRCLRTEATPQIVMKMIADREKTLGALDARLAAIRTAPQVLDLEVRRLEKEARSRAKQFSLAMTRNTEEARAALETLLGRPLTFAGIETDAGKRFQVAGEIALEALFLTEGTSKAPDEAVGCPKNSVPSGTRILRRVTIAGELHTLFEAEGQPRRLEQRVA